MAKKESIRLSLTKKQLASAAGTELLVLCQNVTADGSLSEEEISQLRIWLDDNRSAGLPSIEFLAITVERIIADGKVTKEERKELYQALEAILPTEARQSARARRIAIERGEAAQAKAEKLAAVHEERQKREWHSPLESFDFMVAGVHYDGRYTVIRKHLDRSGPVFLVRDPSNRFSSDAVRIRLENGMEIGFVPEDDAQEMSVLLDEGHPYTATVKKVLSGGRAPIPVILAKFYERGVKIQGMAEKVPSFQDHPYPKESLGKRVYEYEENPAQSSSARGRGYFLLFLIALGVLAMFFADK